MKMFTLMAFSLAMGQFFLIMLVWFTAYANPNNAVTIFINRMGEMQLELILLPPIFLYCLGALLYEWKLKITESAKA